MNPWPARLTAWALVLGFCYGVWHFGSQWQNPWATGVPAPAVVNVLPAMPQCGEDCK